MGACLGSKQPNRRSLQTLKSQTNNPSSIVLRQTKLYQNQCQGKGPIQSRISQTKDLQLLQNSNVKRKTAKQEALKQQQLPEANKLTFDDDQYLRSITKSSIIKITKRKGNKENNKKQQIKQECQLNVQYRSSSKHQNNMIDSLKIKLPNLDIQFMLPKVQAGPLIIPYIDFNQYQT